MHAADFKSQTKKHKERGIDSKLVDTTEVEGSSQATSALPAAPTVLIATDIHGAGEPGSAGAALCDRRADELCIPAVSLPLATVNVMVVGSSPELGVSFAIRSPLDAHLAAHFGVKLDRVCFASLALGDGIHDRHEGVF